MDGKAKRRRSHRPRYGKISFASDYSGRSKSRIYELAAEHRGLIRKDGASSLVDMDVLDDILDEFPIAVIKPSTKSVAADSADDTDILDLPIADIKSLTKSVTAKSAKDSDNKKPGQTVGSESKLLAPKLKTLELPRAKSASTSSTADDLTIPTFLRRANSKCEENDR
jgi:hypothetical protein